MKLALLHAKPIYQRFRGQSCAIASRIRLGLCLHKAGVVDPFDEIEGCGAGGGVQALALAWNSQYEWRDRNTVIKISPEGKKVPLYHSRAKLFSAPAPMAAPAFPW